MRTCERPANLRDVLRGAVSTLAAVAAALCFVVPAHASEPLADVDVTDARLAVNRAEEALVTYRRADGRVRRVLVWGAINARHPNADVPQVRFRYDYAGGWGKYRRLAWKDFRNVCGRYTGPPLVHLVAACTAPDGSHWALQSWQRRLPLLGFEPFLPLHDDFELHVSHWRGPLGHIDASANWTYGGGFEGLFGRLTYVGVPVHGFGTTRTGNPRDRYGRNLYIDTLDSAYGPGWRREAGIVAHRPTGTFCHSFVPQRPHPGYPSREVRPAAPGRRYRITVMGPGVTPVLQWEGPGLGAYDAGRDAQLNALFDRLMAGDRVCAAER